MKSVAVVMDGGDGDVYKKVDARRYYADLNVKVYYFRCHSQYWVNFLRKLEIPIIAIDTEVSNKLTLLGLPHSTLNSTNLKEHLKLI